MTNNLTTYIFTFILLLFTACFLTSCSEEGLESFEVPEVTHTCKMKLNADFTGFDSKDGSTRASINGWEDGDVVYISFSTSNYNCVGGKATYDASNGEWTITYTGSFSSAGMGSAKVYYFDGKVSGSSSLSFDPTVGVYADLNGSYNYSLEDGITVSANLTPRTSRIRLKGIPGDSIKISGIKSYTSFNIRYGTIIFSSISESITITSDGYTPYIYGVFADSSEPSICINYDGCKFTKLCSNSMFQIGESGWMNVPTRSAHENWEMEELIKAQVVLADSDNDGVRETLIFYYDDVDHSREGIVYELNTGDVRPQWQENNKNITNVIFDPSFAYAKPTSTSFWFDDCSNLTRITGIKYLETSNVTNMTAMFWCCSRLKELDLSNFNTVKVTDMKSMFKGCNCLTELNVSNFNTSNVTNMYNMFQGCAQLTKLNLNSFDTSNVINMTCMFDSCTSLLELNLNNFITLKVKDMHMMFQWCSSLTELDLSSFDTSNVQYMYDMFLFCSSLTKLNVRNFNTTNVVNMRSMFRGCSGLNDIDISSFNISPGTNIETLFYWCDNLSSINVGSNDFIECEDGGYPVFSQVGSPSNPCELIIDEGFDTSVLGTLQGNYYYWRGGYFAEPTKYECVDLGLPSGTLWATFNVGAKSPEEYGDYYRFGEIETRDYYGSDNYNIDFSSILTPIVYKSDSYLAALKNEYDVANVKWGKCWNMPSMKQIEELFVYCSAESELLNGVLCTKIIGPNGNFIYFPLNGYRKDKAYNETTQGRYYCGETVVYNNNKDYVFIDLSVLKDYVKYTIHEKAISGYGIRPVQKPKEEILPTSATIDRDSVVMQIGETITLTGTIYPENATYKYGKWQTSNDKIVSVDKNTGTVTALASGTAIIEFSDTYSYLFDAACTIIVK